MRVRKDEDVVPGVQFNRHLDFKAWVRAQVKARVKDAFRDCIFWLWFLRRGLRHFIGRP